jgi:GT2 family glycosyltransferase
VNDQRRRASIIIPVFNQVFYTRVCLASLEREQGEAEVILVDNGSRDETPQVLATWAAQDPGRRVVTHSENQGFARGCNSGADATTREFLVFLNNDTFVLAGWLANLLEPFEDSTVWVTGSRLLYPSGHVQHVGVAFDDVGPHHAFVGLAGNSPMVLEPRDYQAVTGAALAIRSSVFRHLGGFDESYENSFEDVDLCLRVRKDGGRVMYVPDSVAYHFESMTEGRVGPTDMRNYELFMARWADTYERDLRPLQDEAAAVGIDLERERIPSRREVMDREQKLVRAAAELELLRMIVGMRTVRVALWARNLFRRFFPARHRPHS